MYRPIDLPPFYKAFAGIQDFISEKQTNKKKQQ